MKVVLASSNKGKIKEFKAILTPYNITVISLEEAGFFDEIIEDGNSFLENAIIKAKTVYSRVKIPVIADDSGLCCDGLDGAPGIYSARYMNLSSSIERSTALLDALKDNKNRKASFHCSLIFYLGENEYYHFEGILNGYINKTMKGTNGFGYDPIFALKFGEKTLAELSDLEKNNISHRRLALDKFVRFLENDFINKWFSWKWKRCSSLNQ